MQKEHPNQLSWFFISLRWFIIHSKQRHLDGKGDQKQATSSHKPDEQNQPSIECGGNLVRIWWE